MKRGGEVRGQALARLATRQHGVVGRRQLQALGIGPDAMKRWLRSSGPDATASDCIAAASTKTIGANAPGSQ